MKRREFYISENRNYPERGAKYLCSTCAPRPVAVYIHTREVSPDYDKAVQGLVEALKVVTNGFPIMPGAHLKCCEALEAFEKVKGYG